MHLEMVAEREGSAVEREESTAEREEERVTT